MSGLFATIILVPFNHGKTGHVTISQGEISATGGAEPGK